MIWPILPVLDAFAISAFFVIVDTMTVVGEEPLVLRMPSNVDLPYQKRST